MEEIHNNLFSLQHILDKKIEKLGNRNTVVYNLKYNYSFDTTRFEIFT